MNIITDLVSQFDETMSVTTDISDDDAAFMPSDMPVDDPFGASAGEYKRFNDIGWPPYASTLTLLAPIASDY